MNIDSKICPTCGKEFFKKVNCSRKEWNTKTKYCCVECARITLFKKGQSSWNKGLKGYRAGELNNYWKGGITTENEKFRKSPEYKQWRKDVLKRDKYICQECGQVGGKLQAHHIKSFSKYPEFRLVIDNGITLCISCHKKIHPNLNGFNKS